MAKFKVGDKVYWKEDRSWGKGVVKKITRPGKYEVEFMDEGTTLELGDSDIAYNSTNAVVANALAARGAVAKNGEVAVNWQRKEDYLHVVASHDELVGVYNNYKMGRNLDVDRAEEGAYRTIGDVIQKLSQAADVFRRERKD